MWGEVKAKNPSASYTFAPVESWRSRIAPDSDGWIVSIQCGDVNPGAWAVLEKEEPDVVLRSRREAIWLRSCVLWGKPDFANNSRRVAFSVKAEKVERSRLDRESSVPVKKPNRLLLVVPPTPEPRKKKLTLSIESPKKRIIDLDGEV